MIPLEDAAISTSGDYERYFEEDGVRYHHIRDPGTGKSTHTVRSTSIIGNVATDTDALSHQCVRSRGRCWPGTNQLPAGHGSHHHLLQGWHPALYRRSRPDLVASKQQSGTKGSLGVFLAQA